MHGFYFTTSTTPSGEIWSISHRCARLLYTKCTDSTSRPARPGAAKVPISHDFGMNPKMLDLGPGLQCAFFQWRG
eukprot:scaffold27637_cov78-Skeletonema_dohrnii-CCMP3373.AAC.1